MFLKLRSEKIMKLNNNYIFENIIILIYVLFGIIGWQFNYTVGAILTVILAISLILIYNDFKYAIPACLTLLFSIGQDLVVEEIPYNIIIPVVVFFIFIVYFTIRNFKLEKLRSIKSCIGMIILSIGFIIPIFWATLITSENMVFYVMYFSWLMYTLLYVLLCINLKKGSFRMMVFSFSWLSVFIGYELVISCIRIYLDDPTLNILSYWYYVGWGLCNEAGIVLCFLLPFVCYEIYKSNTMKLSLLSCFKLLFALLGIFITTSRGAIVIGGVEVFLLGIVLLFTKHDLKLFKISLIFFPALIAGTLIGIIYGIDYFIQQIHDQIFYQNFGLNGRDIIWASGADTFLASTRNMIFGGGIVSDIEEVSVFNKMQYSFIVYHSTTLEILVSSGIIGLVGLGIHLAEKYKMLFKKGFVFLLIFGIGYLMVDLYGMVDNTYGMYYYMVPLCIMMASINVNDNFEIYHNSKLNYLF